MTKIRSTKNALISAILVLCMAFTGLLGTTFAWFTDSVTSSGNKIVAGTLKVDLELMDKNGNWKSLKRESAPIFESEQWEPGHTEVKILKVENEGSLALSWKTVLTKYSEISALAEVIDVYVRDYGVLDDAAASALTYPQDRNLAGYTLVGTAAEFLSTMEATTKGFLEAEQSAYLGLALKMRESADNKYQGLSLGGTFDITVLATQGSFEEDSFDETYDKNADWPYYSIDYTVKTALEEGQVDASGALTEEIPVGKADDQVSAVVPSGVKMADGATSLDLNVKSMEAPTVDLDLAAGETAKSIDVHIEGVAEDNTTPMRVALKALLPAGLNDNNVKLYHVEGGTHVEMTLVTDPVNHNEFSYDPLTGDVVMTIASFSEIIVQANTVAAWDGTVATAFAGGTGTEADPYLIANASQLAYFRNQVDGGTTYKGQFVKLTANINLADINFDPIGFGYDYDGFMKDGKTFNGTFNGGNFTIFGLYQNGWDLDPDKENYSTYTYSMAGGGLFASVVDATIKNLTISGADIVFECVDMGVVVGYAQGNCTFDSINIVNCTIQNYNRYTGGVVGEVSPRYNADGTPIHSNHIFNNINVDSSTVISSLWGSFDTSLGGILGGKWDKNGATSQVTMTDCNVACKIDAYNDVTSAYQWYAYRRAGMLVGNTEQSSGHTATASFLTCRDVYVYYGEWNNYHYCEFTNQSDEAGSSVWYNNYPWVRVESGLSSSAYSNPRYGHPIVNGTAIVDSIHTHQSGDDCMVSLPFTQLYGGGQGVYGAQEHKNADGTEGVREGKYTVTYIDHGETIKVEFVRNNSEPHALWNAEGYTYGDYTFGGWVDATGKTITGSIAKDNTKNYILYPKWNEELTIRFLDAENNVLYYEMFIKGESHTLNTNAVDAALKALQAKIDADKDAVIVKWETDPDTIDFASATSDIVIKAKYELANTKIKLEPVYDANDPTKLVAYQFSDYDFTDNEYANIVVPSYIGTTPVTTIKDDVFAGYTNLVSVEIPGTITSIGSNAFEDGPNKYVPIRDRSTITIYYSGDASLWKKYMDNFYKTNSHYTSFNSLGSYNDDYTILQDSWDSGLGDGSRIFFLDENGKVINDGSVGYWELYHHTTSNNILDSSRHKYTWVYHEHTYTNGVAHSGCNRPVSSDQYTNYLTDELNNAERPDKKYWE